MFRLPVLVLRPLSGAGVRFGTTIFVVATSNCATTLFSASVRKYSPWIGLACKAYALSFQAGGLWGCLSRHAVLLHAVVLRVCRC